MLKRFKSTIVMLIKFALFTMLFAIFFLIFGIENAWLLHMSRTAATTILTFLVLGSASMSIYGGYRIGIYKSKPIISSMTLSTVITDFVTYIQLCIMNTNSANNQTFRFENVHLLLLVLCLQFIVIVGFAYFGNYIYFFINSPEKCCVITTSKTALNSVVPKIKKYRKQYEITDMILFTSPDLFDIIDRCDTVFVYDVPISSRTMIVEYCYSKNKNIYYNFEMCDVVALRGRTAILDDKPLYASQVKELTFEQRAVKRAFDVFFSVLGLIILSPLFALCAILIKAEDGGKVLFKQKRATKDGKIFSVYKFRTMKEKDSVNRSVTSDDDRITKVGNLLRKFRIDELPQLINIIKGDMSIVGPRPEMVENVDEYEDKLPEFSYRLRVKAGLTGHAQIAGKYNTSPKDKLVLDLMYIEKYSLWLDFKLIFQTLTVFFKAAESTEAFGHGEEFEFFTQDTSDKKEK
ncbi:MAG: exopolysaccharide biosynthesis polyprenyl glycosylphosphotransferase [Clostridia bacterium]|nr:exopolysaccharide biosynthesis polyprenyl glycosylphosphotransferase [Clostridia bacterium]